MSKAEFSEVNVSWGPFISKVVSGLIVAAVIALGGYLARLDSRAEALEERTGKIEVRATTQDAAIANDLKGIRQSVSETREDVRDIRNHLLGSHK